MEVYVFPLGQILLYPASAKPLHIFEVRYIQMVHDSIQNHTPIAIGFVDNPDIEHSFQPGQPLEFVRPLVGYGRPVIVEERADGSIIIFLQGMGKARLGRVIDNGKPYITCEADAVVENHHVQEHNYGAFLTVQKVLVQWMHSRIMDPHARSQFLANIRTPEEVVGCYASYALADRDMQQLILESDDINEKIHLLTGLISSGELA